MSQHRDQLLPLANAYAKEKHIEVRRFLGDGNDGAVWETSLRTALKILERQSSYERERDAYRRLQQCEVTEIEGFAVPQLVASHDTLFAVEMTIVFSPCILDFAKSYVDQPPDFPAEALADWLAETSEMFAEKWPKVEAILGWLQAYGIHYYDAKPGNIRFEDATD